MLKMGNKMTNFSDVADSNAKTVKILMSEKRYILNESDLYLPPTQTLLGDEETTNHFGSVRSFPY